MLDWEFHLKKVETPWGGGEAGTLRNFTFLYNATPGEMDGHSHTGDPTPPPLLPIFWEAPILGSLSLRTDNGKQDMVW